MDSEHSTFAKTIVKYLAGKEVQVYCGDSGETRKFNDFDTQQKNVVTGVVIEASGDCLVLKCKKHNKSNLLYINSWSISSVVEVNGGPLIGDLYHDEHIKSYKRN